MLISVVYVNWNSTKYLRGSIKSVYDHTAELEPEIVVIDNASPDRDIASIVGEFPNVRIMQMDCNVGFAVANNIGARAARGKWLVFLNPDTIVLPGAFDTMLESGLSLPRVGILGAKLYNEDLSLQLTAIRAFPTIVNQVFNAAILQRAWPSCWLWDDRALLRDSTTAAPVDGISGACMMLARDVFMQVGGFCEDYFMYGEDVDICYRVRAAGYDNYLIPNARIVHYGGASSKRQKSEQWAVQWMMRSRYLYFTKTRGTVYAMMFRLIMGCASAVRLILIHGTAVVCSYDRDLQYAGEKWKAVLKWAFGFGEVVLPAERRRPTRLERGSA
ncbi:MAG: glycosyltransferase family 2 protein [Bryobacteraceae bacterium]